MHDIYRTDKLSTDIGENDVIFIAPKKVLWCFTQKIKTFEESELMFAVIVRPELQNVSFIYANYNRKI